jgi:hypothetical protein
VKEAVREGVIPITDIIKISKLPKSQREEIYTAIEKGDTTIIKERTRLASPKLSPVESYINQINEWFDSGKELLNMKRVENLDSKLARVIKTHFDNLIIPFYNRLTELVSKEKKKVQGVVTETEEEVKNWMEI